MKINPEFMLRNIAGDRVIVPTGDASQRFNGLMTLNEVAVVIWEEVEKGKTPEEIVAILLKEYDVCEELAEKDVNGFLNMLREHNILLDD